MLAQKTKIAVIGTVGLPSRYGGFETLTDHLVTNLGKSYDFSVYCTGKKYTKSQRLKNYKGARLFYLPLNANGIQSIFYDAFSILHALFYADVLLVLGVAGAWIFPFVRLLTNKKIIVSVDGVEWKRDKWSRPAKLYLWLAEKIAVKYSHIDISDNEAIQDYTAYRYGTLSRVVEYGGDHVKSVEATNEDFEKYPFLKYLYAVKVCRIEPENNVHLVLEAFTDIQNRQLVMIGNWNNSAYGRELKARYSGYDNIVLLDPIYDDRILNLIRSNASLYIHGHCAGGTNPSLVEAMTLGLPVLAFNVSYNKATTEGKAAYFNSVEEIRKFVRETFLDQLKRNGRLMKAIAEKRYTWRLIAGQYSRLFTEVLKHSQRKSVMSELSAALNEGTLSGQEVAHLHHHYRFFEKR
jgi:glycosyltransferase involved in cell wall biosynthesis